MSSNENARPDRHRKRAEAKRVNQPTKHPDQTQPKPAEGGSIFRPPAGPAWAEPSVAQLVDRYLTLADAQMRLVLADLLSWPADYADAVGPDDALYYPVLLLSALKILDAQPVPGETPLVAFRLPAWRRAQAEVYLLHEPARKPGGGA